MDCVSIHTEIAPALPEFTADMHLRPFTHGMRGPTWLSAELFVGALHFFPSRRAFSKVGVVRVENESIFLSDHYRVILRLLTLPALIAPGKPAS